MAITIDAWDFPGADGDRAVMPLGLPNLRTGLGEVAHTIIVVRKLDNLDQAQRGCFWSCHRESMPNEPANHSIAFEPANNNIEFAYALTPVFEQGINCETAAGVWVADCYCDAGNGGAITLRRIPLATATQSHSVSGADGGSTFSDGVAQRFELGAAWNGTNWLQELDGQIALFLFINDTELSQAECEAFVADPLNVGDALCQTHGLNAYFYDDSGADVGANGLVAPTLFGGVTRGAGNGPTIPNRDELVILGGVESTVQTAPIEVRIGSTQPITFLGIATTPADNAAQAGPTVAITPPASMLNGDLVYVSVRYRASAGTLTVADAGGQTWESTTQYNTTNIRARVFWCRFNGTWSANPSFTVTTGTNNMDAQMLVFRPTSTAYTWFLESGPNSATYAAPTTPFTVTVTGRTTSATNTVSIAAWHSIDDNSWATLAGSGWSKTGLGAQYRNNSTADNSSTFAYRILTSAGATNDVSQNQSALGGDAGSTSLFTFAESTGGTIPPGVAATVSAGSLGVVAIVAGIAGVLATALVGTVNAVIPSGGADVIVTPISVAATATAGSVVTPFAAVAQPPGVGSGAMVGAVAASIVALPPAVVGTAQAGTALGVPAAPGGVPVLGVGGLTTAGSLGGAITVAGIAGVSSSAAAGTVVVSSGGIVLAAAHPSPVFATAQVGQLAVLSGPMALGVSTALAAEPFEVTLVSCEIDGVQAVAIAGDLSQRETVPPEGVAATGAVGTLAWNASSLIGPLGGVAATGAIGNVIGIGTTFASVTPAFSGVSTTAIASVLAPQWTQVITPISVTADAQVGTLSAVVPATGNDAIATPSGVVTSAVVGVLALQLTRVVAPIGVASAAQLGTVLVVVPSPVNSITAAPPGVAATARVGTAIAAWTVLVPPLAGVEATAAVGDVTAEGGDSVSEEIYPVGVTAFALVGTVTTGEAAASVASVTSVAQAGTITVLGVGPVTGYLTATIQVRPALEATIQTRPALDATEVTVRPL